MIILIASILLFLFISIHALAPAVNRRSAIQAAATGLLTQAALIGIQPSVALLADDLSLTVPKGKSVLVLGANGKTGRECVAAALSVQRPCVATSRSGIFEWEGDTDQLTSSAIVDVTSRDSIANAIASTKNLGAVIFAASASASGSTPFPRRSGWRRKRCHLLHCCWSSTPCCCIFWYSHSSG